MLDFVSKCFVFLFKIDDGDIEAKDFVLYGTAVESAGLGLSTCGGSVSSLLAPWSPGLMFYDALFDRNTDLTLSCSSERDQFFI